MLKFFVALLMVTGGMAETDICDAPPQCRHDGMNQGFPETEEELQTLCKYLKVFVECELHYDQTCGKIEPERVQLAYRLIATLDEVCAEDTLLHGAVVDSLKCFKELLYDDTVYCPLHDISPDRLHEQATSLIEEEILSLEYYENNTQSVTKCIALMNFIACHSLLLEKHCGAITMDAYIDIMQKIGPGAVAGCGEAYEPILPAVIRLHKLEEEKEQSIVEAFRKRK